VASLRGGLVGRGRGCRDARLGARVRFVPATLGSTPAPPARRRRIRGRGISRGGGMTGHPGTAGGGSVEVRAVVSNRYGLHARPAAELVKLAGTFAADVRVAKGDLEVNGKSIMGVLMLAAE